MDYGKYGLDEKNRAPCHGVAGGVLTGSGGGSRGEGLNPVIQVLVVFAPFFMKAFTAPTNSCAPHNFAPAVNVQLVAFIVATGFGFVDGQAAVNKSDVMIAAVAEFSANLVRVQTTPGCNFVLVITTTAMG